MEKLYITCASNPVLKMAGGWMHKLPLILLGGSILHFFCDRPPGQTEIETLDQQLLKSKISQV